MTVLDSSPNARPGIDATDVAAHLRSLLVAVPWAMGVDLATAAGVSPKTVKAVLHPDGPLRGLRSGPYARLMHLRAEDIRVPQTRIIDGAGTRAAVAALTERGWRIADIARSADLGIATLMPENLDRVQARTARRALWAAAQLRERTPIPQCVPECRVLRRVEALMTQGWPRGETAQRAGVSHGAIQHSPGHSMKALYVAEQVAEVFTQLRYQVGPSSITMRRARVLGYAPWAAWEDGALDDPLAIPDASAVDDPLWRGAILSRYQGREARSAA